MATKIRMYPPTVPTSPVVCGDSTGRRTYSPAAAAFQDVQLVDQMRVGSVGWTPIAMVGTTAERPYPGDGTVMDGATLRGQVYIDTTLGAVIQHDGAVWRNVLTGAAV